MRPVHLVLMLVVLTSLSGCLGSSDTSGEAPGTYTVESTLTSIEVETKSAYNQPQALRNDPSESDAASRAKAAKQQGAEPKVRKPEAKFPFGTKADSCHFSVVCRR